MSPSLPPSFDQRESLLASLGDYGSSSFGHEMAIKVHACTCTCTFIINLLFLHVLYAYIQCWITANKKIPLQILMAKGPIWQAPCSLTCVYMYCTVAPVIEKSLNYQHTCIYA